MDRPLAALGVVGMAILLGACDDRSVTAEPASRFVERVVPPRVSTSGKPPLVVLLHGIGADEHDLLPLADELDPRATVVALRAPYPHDMGFAWFHIDWHTDGSIAVDVPQARAALADLVRWLADASTRLGTDPKRLYLFGFSQGAMMSYGVLQTTPERLAGVIALSGRFGDALFDASAPREAIARVPLFVGHGTHDDVLPVANGRTTRDSFQPFVRDFTYREYPIGHGIGATEIRDVASWLRDRLDRP